MSFFFGTPGQWSQRSTLGAPQQDLFNQLQQTNRQGTFSQAGDYYRNLLSDNPQDLQSFAAPEMRQFNEQIIPGLAEQFAGLGSGGLSSSGFRNAAVNAGTDLSERIAAIRAGLRSQGAQGLFNLGQQGLGNYYQNIYTQGQPGFLDFLGQGLGSAGTSLGSAFALNRLFNRNTNA